MSTEPQEPQGLSQILPSTFAAYAEPGETIDDPAANFRAAHRYIKDRYGSTAAPVAQEPPAPMGRDAADELTGLSEEMGLYDPAPGNAQEPADPPHEWLDQEQRERDLADGPSPAQYQAIRDALVVVAHQELKEPSVTVRNPKCLCGPLSEKNCPLHPVSAPGSAHTGGAQELADPLPDFEADAFDMLCRFVSPVQAAAAAKTVLPILRAGIETELREKIAAQIEELGGETPNDVSHAIFLWSRDVAAVIRGQS